MRLFPLVFGHALRLEQFDEVVTYAVSDKDGLRVLRQQREVAAVEGAVFIVADRAARDADLPAVGTIQSGKDIEGRGLAGTVAAEETVKFPVIYAQ